MKDEVKFTNAIELFRKGKEDCQSNNYQPPVHEGERYYYNCGWDFVGTDILEF